MKDYFDLLALAREGRITRERLVDALTATFGRRGTHIPFGTPIGLDAAFARDASKLAQWRGFVARQRLTVPPLGGVVEELAAFYLEPLAAARGRLGRT